VGDVEEQYSQPTNENIEKVFVQLNSYGNPKKAKKQVWGPVLAQKRSKRVPNDGKTMMERAQELKRNQDLEIPQDKNNKNSFVSVTISLANIAVDLGVVHKDGHPLPQNMLDSMVSLDAQRATNFEKICNQKTSQAETFVIASDQVKKELDSSLDHNLIISEQRGSQGGCPDFPILIDDEEDREGGWSKVRVGRRKKKKGRK
jgi:hypothetical protein